MRSSHCRKADMLWKVDHDFRLFFTILEKNLLEKIPYKIRIALTVSGRK